MAAPKILCSKHLPKRLFLGKVTGFTQSLLKLYQECLTLSGGRGGTGVGRRDSRWPLMSLSGYTWPGFSRSSGVSCMVVTTLGGRDHPCPSPGPQSFVPLDAPFWC